MQKRQNVCLSVCLFVQNVLASHWTNNYYLPYSKVSRDVYSQPSPPHPPGQPPLEKRLPLINFAHICKVKLQSGFYLHYILFGISPFLFVVAVTLV